MEVFNIGEKICLRCSKKINLSDHPLGLVFEDKHFLCQDCNSKNTKKDISKFTKTIMQSPQNGMPITLWLIHEQNKNKTMMTMEKKKL